MYVYEIAPIDFCWEMLHSVEDVAATLARSDAAELTGKGSCGLPNCDEFFARWEHAKIVAGEAGWAGDIRTGPAVFWIPCDSAFDYGFVFKQDTNGITYVVSPRELPHLDSR